VANDKWAQPDYEATADEIQEFIENTKREWTPGSHGSVVIIPTLEPALRAIEDLYLANRYEDEEGLLHYDWLVPRRRGRH
jgi:hypothetical protein